MPRLTKEARKWSWREELNLQPAVYKTAALPLSYASLSEIGSRERRTAERKPNNCLVACQATRPSSRYLPGSSMCPLATSVREGERNRQSRTILGPQEFVERPERLIEPIRRATEGCFNLLERLLPAPLLLEDVKAAKVCFHDRLFPSSISASTAVTSAPIRLMDGSRYQP